MYRYLAILMAVTLSLSSIPSNASVLSADEVLGHERFLSPLGQTMLAEPGSAAEVGKAFGETLLADAGSAEALVTTAYGGLLAQATVDAALPPADALWQELADAWQASGHALTKDAILTLQQETATLDPRIATALAALVNGETHARALTAHAFDRLDVAALIAVLGHAASEPYTHSDGTAALLPETGPDFSLLEETEALLSSLDLAALQAANVAMAGALDEALAQIASLRDEAPTVTAPLAAPGDVFSTDTPYGTIVVSGQGSNTYTERHFVSLDLGGDDVYNNPTGAVKADLIDSGSTAAFLAVSETLYALSTAPGVPPLDAYDAAWRDAFLTAAHRTHNASIVIDLSGADVYDHSLGNTQGSGGFGGFGALVDLAGNDRYSAYRHAQGDGQVAGVGLLLDLAGDDTYTADAQAQGFGQVSGLGLLADLDGTDTYSARVIAQGLGWDLGAGVLIDARGNDGYTCWGVDNFSDSILPVNLPRPGTTCQATGWGGAGVIIEADGDDRFFTAAGFQTLTLIGTTLLVDLAGSDTHIAGEWSVSVGVLGAAALVDVTGNDLYQSHMVLDIPWLDIYIGGNGEGYLGAAVLADGDGDDVYTTDVRKDLHLVQYACGNGCAHDGGVGILLDGSGDDSYLSEVGQGGTSGGVALLLDGSGTDTYALRYNSTRAQGFAGFDPIVGPGLTGTLMTCIYGILIDGDGLDSYANPVVDFGARTNDAHWGQGELGRGMDGTDGIRGYLTSSEFAADLNKLAATAGCNTVTN